MLIINSNAITSLDSPLLDYLQQDLTEATGVKLIISFLMETGAQLLIDDLKHLSSKGVPIKILTGRYLHVTQPSAIYLLKKELGQALDIRFYKQQNISFHPKAYIIDMGTDGVVYVGSSNLSRSALTTGIEWNFRLQKWMSPNDYAVFNQTFDRMFEQESEIVTDEILKDYAAGWRKNIFTTSDLKAPTPSQDRIKPRGAQIEALYCLEEARKEGIKKGLVVAATGVGKTYLAAFDSQKFAKVLFVAHKEEILLQAASSFRQVRPDAEIGFLYGAAKDISADLLFATVQTMGQERYLTQFSPTDFDYLVIDEFHHAAADSYQRLLNYFKPKFLLGLTATPYRMDNRDILALCDDNVIYEIYLRDAINRGLLVPFHYYAIYDDTDYEQIDYRNGRYDQEQLEKALSSNYRAALVLDKFAKFSGQKCLGFCASIKHAEFMAEYFSQNKVPACVVHSGQASSPHFLPRQEAIKQLQEGKLRVIFNVDLFSEGVDIPEVDLVMFLRPTESYVVFLQQLGRGLRQSSGKEHLKVLDFIGNYKRAHHIPLLLAGKNPMAVEGRKLGLPHEIEYPDECFANFDFKLIDLFAEMRKRDPISQRIKEEYWRLAKQLRRRPTRLDVFEGIDIPINHFLKDDGWLGFLASVGELTEEEQSWLKTPAAGFLREIERTGMVKSYKMPTLLSFLAGSSMLPEASTAKIAECWRDFYSDPVHEQDMLRDKSTSTWREWDDEKLAKLAVKNPVHFLTQSSKFFHYDEINQVFSIDESVRPYLSPSLAEHFWDILTWRSKNYYAVRYRKEEE